MLKAYMIEFRSGSSHIRSYTLFGAFCWGYRFLNGEKALIDFLEEFKEKPKFLISSPFPLLNINGENKPLFPKPIIPLEYEEISDICLKKQRKKFKKARYITYQVFKDFINGKIQKENDFITGSYKIHDNLKSVMLTVEECNLIEEANINFYQSKDINVKNIINRITNTSLNLYTEERLHFSSLYFMIYFYDPSFESEFNKVLEFISFLGLGANKNIGWGDVKFKEFNINLSNLVINNTEKFITLSPIIPTRSIDIQNSFYEFETYKAPMENSFSRYLMKKKVLYLKEGSVLRSKEEGFKGKLEQVVKNPEIYQYGFEFPVKVHSNGEK